MRALIRVFAALTVFAAGCGKTTPSPLTPVDPPTPAPTALSDKDRLQGVWRVESWEDRQKNITAAEIDVIRFVFEGDKVQVRLPRRIDDHVMALDTSANPTAIVLTPTGKDRPKQEWIYRFDGDALVLAIPDHGPRPTEFNRKPSDDVMLVRLKKTNEPPTAPVKVEPKPDPVKVDPKPTEKKDPAIIFLDTDVNTAGNKSPVADWYNDTMTNLKAYKTVNSLVITFDINMDGYKNNPGRFGVPMPLLVRVFDEDGKHLTHFTTAEEFTYRKDHPLLGGRLILLQEKKNEFTYSVQRRDLRDAAKIEVGFYFRLP